MGQVGRRSGQIVDSLDSAFEWLVIILTVLLGILFQFLTWISKPPDGQSMGDLKTITKLMTSLTIPLVVCTITWLYQKISSTDERRMWIRLFAWNGLIQVYVYYMCLFIVSSLLSSIPSLGPLVTATLIVISIYVVSDSISSTTVLTKYKGATLDNGFWNKGKVRTNLPQILGVAVNLILILFFLLVL